jgi:hypothetical protein
MALTDKDVFIQVRASKRQRDVLKAMAKKRGLDMTGMIFKMYRKELRAAKAKALDADLTLDQYLKLDKS